MKLTLERVAAVLREQGLEEHVGAVLDALTKKPKQTPGAARQARYREKRQADPSVTKGATVSTSSVTFGVTVTPSRDALAPEPSVTKGVTVTPKVTPLARVDSDSPDSESTGKDKKDSSAKAASRSVTPTPRQILLECGLSPDIADAVLAHRRALRRPLTVRAAQLLAKGFLATADPNAAADMMIERGWQGFRAEWFDNERAGNGRGKQGKRSISDVAPGFIERLDKQFAYLDEVRSEDRRPEGGPAVRVLPAQRGQRS
jgi:hypothetical protein